MSRPIITTTTTVVGCSHDTPMARFAVESDATSVAEAIKDEAGIQVTGTFVVRVEHSSHPITKMAKLREQIKGYDSVEMVQYVEIENYVATSQGEPDRMWMPDRASTHTHLSHGYHTPANSVSDMTGIRVFGLHYPRERAVSTAKLIDALWGTATPERLASLRAQYGGPAGEFGHRMAAIIDGMVRAVKRRARVIAEHFGLLRTAVMVPDTLSVRTPLVSVQEKPDLIPLGFPPVPAPMMEPNKHFSIHISSLIHVDKTYVRVLACGMVQNVKSVDAGVHPMPVIVSSAKYVGDKSAFVAYVDPMNTGKVLAGGADAKLASDSGRVGAGDTGIVCMLCAHKTIREAIAETEKAGAGCHPDMLFMERCE